MAKIICTCAGVLRPVPVPRTNRTNLLLAAAQKAQADELWPRFTQQQALYEATPLEVRVAMPFEVWGNAITGMGCNDIEGTSCNVITAMGCKAIRGKGCRSWVTLLLLRSAMTAFCGKTYNLPVPICSLKWHLEKNFLNAFSTQGGALFESCYVSYCHTELRSDVDCASGNRITWLTTGCAVGECRQNTFGL